MFEKQPQMVRNILEKQPQTVEVNPFADIMDVPEEPIREDPSMVRDWRLDAPINNPNSPRRTGPSIWWEKDITDLHPQTIWHRIHRMSPAYGVPGEEVRRAVGAQRQQPSLKDNWYDKGE